MAISWDSLVLELLKIYVFDNEGCSGEPVEIYIYIERERVKNALFISLIKIYGRLQTVKQLILKHCCWLLLPPLTSSFWGLWMTWYVLTLRFVPECEIFVSVCHYCWNMFPVKSCCLHVYLFANKIFRDISHETETSPFPPFPQIHLPVYFPQNRIFFWIYYIIYLFIIEGQIWLSHPCRGRSGTLCALSSSEWYSIFDENTLALKLNNNDNAQ